MMSAQNVHAKVTRNMGWWAISVDEIPGLFSQARRLDQVDAMVRDAAAMLGFEVANVEIVPILDADAQEMLEELERARHDAEEKQRAASDLTRQAISRFRGEGLTLRDIASLVGLSQQRVSVLMKEG
ncbi:sigma factor-like helix-turn-helix DNA-binding protein [Enorma burkinafasonensis]|uniref:sigma factor-like helix-turn-helix DNA-binding protein n=1 Tax=Enorma burkinafasonensis TaxID=2590867 RepID=UPI0011A6FFDA|nr:sigma factor-like helix-turn-helix DNA-binding protein [Enorma burkinafasonensis]